MKHLCLRFPATTPFARPMPWPFHLSNNGRNGAFNCKLHREEDDRYFQDAMERASLRHQETLRPDPLFTDPYIRCLLPSDVQMDVNQDLHKHCLATKFIDEKLLSTILENDGLKQVVLLTDGIDTRPYRLNWPTSTIIFDISPDRIFRKSIQKLEDSGAKVPRRCLFFHVPSETSDIKQVLWSKGFNGARPSVWVFQGFPLMTLAYFKDILDIVSSLAMKGCFFFGELPSWLVETETGIKSTTMKWMDKLFMSHGLRVKIIESEEVAAKPGKKSFDGDNNILFVAEQLQFSDDQIGQSFSKPEINNLYIQILKFRRLWSYDYARCCRSVMDMWRREFERIEEEGDEEGFEEL